MWLAALGMLLLGSKETRSQDLFKQGIPKEVQRLLPPRPVPKELLVPYIVALGHLDQTSLNGSTYVRFCTGSLISSTWVLTAGHCVEGNQEKIIWIQHGTNFREAVKNVVHHGYDPIKLCNDIGLIQMKDILDVKMFARVSALYRGSLVGKPVKYAGYGLTKKSLKKMKRVLNIGSFIHSTIHISDAVVADCKSFKWLRNGFITDGLFICTMPKCDKIQQAAYKDSGGPLMYKQYVIGVCTGVVLSRTGHVDLYTPVDHYVDWIRDVTVCRAGCES